MSAYRCGTCDVRMPAQEANKCPRCGAALVWKQDDQPPDKNWRKKLALDHQDIDDETVTWRLAQLLAIRDTDNRGIDVVEAEHLAARPEVDYRKIRDLTASGCPIETAVAIIA